MSAAALVPFEESQLATLDDSVREYAQASRAASTLRGYHADWKDFTAWCDWHRLDSLPATPETVARYISDRAKGGKLKAGSIQRRVSAIACFHQTKGLTSPTSSGQVKFIIGGIRRKLGTRQEGKAAVLTADLTAMLALMPAKLLGVRDRALLLVGFAGAFRRSELVALDVEDIEFQDRGPERGLKVTIRRSKTDQESAGQTIGIAHGTNLCPVRALQEWLAAAAITDGPIFRFVDRHSRVHGRMRAETVATVVKKYTAAAGLDPEKYAGHSLRAGFVTQGVICGASEVSIMKTTRHKSSDMLRKYVRDASLFRDNASARLGL